MQIFPSMSELANDVFGKGQAPTKGTSRDSEGFAGFFNTQMSLYDAKTLDRMERELTADVDKHFRAEGQKMDSAFYDPRYADLREQIEEGKLDVRDVLSGGGMGLFASLMKGKSKGKDGIAVLQALAGVKNTSADGSDKANKLAALVAKIGKGAVKTGGSGIAALKNLKMSQEDFSALKEDLKSFGLTKGEIDSLGEKIASEAGLTWGQFVSALSSRLGAVQGAVVQLSPDDQRQLQSLFQKMGFMPNKAEELVGKLESGQFSSVWKSVGKQLESLPAGTKIDVSSGELQLLGQVVKLSDKGIARLKALLGGNERATLTADGLKKVMAQLKTEVAQDVKKDETTVGRMQQVLGDVLEKALERAEVSKKADAELTNDVRNKKILAENSRRERAAAKDGDARPAAAIVAEGEEAVAEHVLRADPKNAGSGKTAKAQAAGAHAEAAAKDGKASSAKAESAANAAPLVDGKQAQNADKNISLSKEAGVRGATDGAQGHKASWNGAKDGAGKDDASAGKDGSGKGKTGDETPWKEFLGKVKSDGRGTEQNLIADEAAKAAEATRQVMSSLGRSSNSGSAFERALSSRMMRQVENGILRNLADGRKQMTLKLDGADLGKLNVMLSVRDKEVSAVIRVDSHEAGKLLGDQMAQLRQTLEQQGLKVQRLEVQTQLNGNNQFSQNWQGAGRHNMAQQQGNSGQYKGMWKNLREGGESLAQEMQDAMTKVNNSQGGLDIFA